jgi:histone H3
MLSRRAPSIQSTVSRRRFEEYSVTEPSISR